MKQSINSYDFHRAFETTRPDSFSYKGLNALFEYFEQYDSAYIDVNQATEYLQEDTQVIPVDDNTFIADLN